MPLGNAPFEILNHREWESVLGEDIYNPIQGSVSNGIRKSHLNRVKIKK